MEAVLFVVGLFMPPIVSWLKKGSWPKELKVLLSMLVCLAAATVVMAVHGDFGSAGDFLKNFAVVWAAAQANYQLYFGDLPFNTTLENHGIH